MEDKYILEYIRDILHGYQVKYLDITSARYHHNSSYDQATSIIKNGILSLEDQVKLKIAKYSKEDLKKLDNIEYHVNGSDGISLAVVGLKDLLPNEMEYDPYQIDLVDFLISSDTMAYRITTHYGNEFVTHESIIHPSKIRTVDIRLLKYIDSLEKKDLTKEELMTIKNKFNALREIAIEIKRNNLNIPIREMSYKEVVLDNEKLSKTYKL